jgi:pilus assembly protein CpaE
LDKHEQMKTGKVVAFCSAKGGVGQTFLATNLAIALQKKYLSITLVDGKLQFGDIAIALDLKPTVTMKDVAEDIARIDHSLISNYLTNHESGIQVLAAPERPEHAELVTNDVIKKAVNMLKDHYDYTVIDCGYAFHDTTLDLLDLADDILVVTTPDMTALKNTKQLLETFHQLSHTPKIKLIVNRFDMEGLIKPEEIPGMLQLNDAEFVSNNFKLASQSLNIGIPVVTRRSGSDLAKDLGRLAECIVSKHPEDIVNRKERSSKKWFGMKK